MGTASPRRPARPAPAGWQPSPAMTRWLASMGAHAGPLPCLYPQDVADYTALAGQPITAETVIQFNSNGARHRREHAKYGIDSATPSDLPAPAGHGPGGRGHGRPAPYWWPWQIDRWQAGRRRPGFTRKTPTEGANRNEQSRKAVS